MIQTPTTTSTLAGRLRLAREMAGLSIEHTAAMTGIAADVIERYERPELEPTVTALAALQEFYQVSWDWLLTGQPSARADRHIAQVKRTAVFDNLTTWQRTELVQLLQALL